MGSGSSARQKYVGTSPASVRTEPTNTISTSSAVFAVSGTPNMESVAKRSISAQDAAQYNRDHEHQQQRHDEDEGDGLHMGNCYAKRDLLFSGRGQLPHVEDCLREYAQRPSSEPVVLETGLVSDVALQDMVVCGQMKSEDDLGIGKSRDSALQSAGMSIAEDSMRHYLVERMPNQGVNNEELPARQASVPAILSMSAASRSSVFQAGQRAQAESTPSSNSNASSDGSSRALRRQSLRCHRMSMTEQFEKERDKLQGEREGANSVRQGDETYDGPRHNPESQVGGGQDEGPSPRDLRHRRKSSYNRSSLLHGHESRAGDNHNQHRRGSLIGAESQMVLQKLKNEKAKEAKTLSQSSRKSKPILVSCTVVDKSVFSSRAPRSSVQVVSHEDAMCGFSVDDVVTTRGGPDADGPWRNMGNCIVVEPDEKLGFLIVRYEKTDTLFSIKAEHLFNITDNSRSGAFFAKQPQSLDRKRVGPVLVEEKWEPVVGESVEILPEGLDAGRGIVVRTKDSKSMVLVRCGNLGMRKVPLKHLYRIRREGIDNAEEALKASSINPSEQSKFTLSVFQSVGMEFNEATAWNMDRRSLGALVEAADEFLDETSQSDLPTELQIGNFVSATKHPIWRDQGIGVVRGKGANGMVMVQFQSGGDTFALAASDLVKERVNGGRLREPGVETDPRLGKHSKRRADSSGNPKDENSGNRRGHGK